MKKMSFVVLACALFLAGVAYGRLTNSSAQAAFGAAHLRQMQQEPKYDPKDPATWPTSLDAVAAAPNNHKVLLENERVRVLEVTIRPGEKEPVHAHRWPSVLYIYSSEDFLDYNGEGKVIFDSRSAQPPLKYPMTLWQEYQPPHAVRNLSQQTPIRLIRIEIKK
jgi:hypothetical protein